MDTAGARSEEPKAGHADHVSEEMEQRCGEGSPDSSAVMEWLRGYCRGCAPVVIGSSAGGFLVLRLVAASPSISRCNVVAVSPATSSFEAVAIAIEHRPWQRWRVDAASDAATASATSSAAASNAALPDAARETGSPCTGRSRTSSPWRHLWPCCACGRLGPLWAHLGAL